MGSFFELIGLIRNWLAQNCPDNQCVFGLCDDVS